MRELGSLVKRDMSMLNLVPNDMSISTKARATEYM